MSAPFDERDEAAEGHPRVTDRRRVDPVTGAVREPVRPVHPVHPASGPGGLPVDAELAAEVDAALQVDTHVAAVEAKVAELTDDLRRVHAEYANYRKRVDRDRDLVRETAVGGVLAELLPVLDDLDRAREHGEYDGALKAVGDAVEAALSRLGLQRYGAVDEAFDPTVHEALTSETREGLAEPTVVAVYQPGYRFAGRVLRPARVAVADGP